MSEHANPTKPLAFLSILIHLRRINQLLGALIVILVLTAVSVLDWLTGPDFSFSLFYSLCIALSALLLGRIPSLAVSLLSAVLATWMDATLGKNDPQVATVIWNITIHAINFSILALLFTELQILIGQLHEHALRDPLTQAANRRYFEDYLGKICKAGTRIPQAMTIAYFDVDDFKLINDELGHLDGDLVLKTIASSILSQIRPDDMLARLGGDEFVLVLRGTAWEQGRIILPRIFITMQSQFIAWKRPVSLSIGAISYAKMPNDAAGILARVDGLMYEAKKTGKGTLKHIQA